MEKIVFTDNEAEEVFQAIINQLESFSQYNDIETKLKKEVLYSALIKLSSKEEAKEQAEHLVQ